VTAAAAASYLDGLNPEQRRAVEHGVLGGATIDVPLLVIAGAGSGKTATLASRVAHLIVNGADPRRILLMTFSRRAAAEMTKRVERIARKALGSDAGIMTDALTWAGTFHGIGARLLREYADRIGLDRAFTIHDREDSTDLMNLVRHERGLSKTESRFPTKGTCLAIYSRCVNTEMPIEKVLGQFYPWCSGWAAELKELFAAYVEAKQKQNVLDYDDLLLYWAQTMSDAALADEIGGRFDHVLVDEYQDTNRLQSSILLALKPGGRGLSEIRRLSLSPPPAHRDCNRPGGFRRERKPTRRRHRKACDLGDHGTESAVANTFLETRQHRFLVAGIDVDDAVRSETDLCQCRRKKILPGDAPEDFALGARSNARREDGCRCAIDGSVATAGNFVKRPERQPAARKPAVDRLDAEWQHRPDAQRHALKVLNLLAKPLNGR
jgi:hypothetical protein